MNKLRPYFQTPGSGEDIIGAWPGLSSALFMDISPDFAARLRQKYPGLKICVRLYEGGLSWQTTSPEDWAAQFIAVHPDYAISWTMPLGQDDHALFAAFDEWSLRFANAVRAYGIEPVGLCVGTGNFTAAPNRIRVSEAFPKICQSYNILGGQDYGWPTLQAQEGWHALRWKAWHDDIKAAFGKEMQFVPMECGITQAVIPGQPDLGWQSYADGVTDESYIAAMRWYNARLCELPYVICAYGYLYHGYGDWATFDHAKKPEVWHVIRDFDAAGEEPEPPIPPVGGSMKVYDFNGTEKDAAWLKNVWGTEVTSPVVRAGQQYFAVQVVRIGEGPCAILNNVKAADGNPMQDVLVAFHWPGAPDPPESGDEPHTTPVYGHDWAGNFVFGSTNVNGDWGGAMGTGAMVNEGGEGPHWCWIHDVQRKSDCVTGLGWRTGTNHRAPRLEWKLVTAGGEEPPNGGDEPMYKLEIVDREVITPWPSAEMVLRYPKRRPDGTDFATDTRGQARIVGVPPETYDPDLELPFEMGDYAAVKNCCDYDGTGPRVYQLMVTAYGSGEPITPVVEEAFNPKPDFRQVIYTVDWVEEEPEPPPSGDYAALLEEMADALDDMAVDLRAVADALGATGEVLNIVVTYQDGRQTVFKPSVVNSVVAAIKSIFRR